MNSSWAARRKMFILSGMALVLSVACFFVFWKVWQRTPTCSDGHQNGNESGIDCGGSCSLVCSSEMVKPIVRWDPRIFPVLPGLWSVLVYVENPNNADAAYVPYVFNIYGPNNEVIKKIEGATILPRNKTVGVFEGLVALASSTTPKKATFEIDAAKTVWKKGVNMAQEINITHGPLLNVERSPRVEANIKNLGLKELKDIEVVITIFDGDDNAIAASRTFVESLKKNESSGIFFTWPQPFKLGSKACEMPADTMLLLDRSGSMASVSKNPPQPLTAVKEAAVSFITQLSSKDKVGVISFAGEASLPPELSPAADFDAAKAAINAVSIGSANTQYTNIYNALRAARQELVPFKDDGSSRVVVLLTDGIPNRPQDPQGRTESDDVKYAEGLSLKESAEAKKEGLVIYAIGLGKEVNSEFLKSLASADSYFFAPTAAELESIYKKISTSICQEVPARIELTYKIFGNVE